MAWGRFTGGRPFAVGFDPRRNITGEKPWRGALRRDTFEYIVKQNPDLALDILEVKGLIPALVERYVTRERRPLSMGGPRWRRPRMRRSAT